MNYYWMHPCYTDRIAAELCYHQLSGPFVMFVMLVMLVTLKLNNDTPNFRDLFGLVGGIEDDL